MGRIAIHTAPVKTSAGGAELPAIPMDVVGHTDVVYSDLKNDKDRVIWCQRR